MPGSGLGWDQSQARTWDAACRHTALSALAQLRQVAIRNALHGFIQLSGHGQAIPGDPEPDQPTTLTCAYRSATHPCPSTPGSRARATSA